MKQEPHNLQVIAAIANANYTELVNEPRASIILFLNLSMRLLVHSLNYYVMMKGPNKHSKRKKISI